VHPLHPTREAKLALDLLPCSTSAIAGGCAIRKHVQHSIDPGRYVLSWYEQSVHAVGNQLARATDTRRDDWRRHRHRFEDRVWGAFPIRRLDEQVECVVQRDDVSLLAQQTHGGVQAAIPNGGLQLHSPRTFASDDQAR